MQTIKGNAKDGGYLLPGEVHVKRRELEVLAMVAHGLSNEEIAERLKVKPQSVINIANNVMRKLNAKNRTHAVSIALKKGMLLMDSEKPKSGYLWCLHCGRTYKYGEYRIDKTEAFTVDHYTVDAFELEMCPYPDCNGDAYLDAWPWEMIREYNPDYPKIPKKDVAYPMYPEKAGTSEQ